MFSLKTNVLYKLYLYGKYNLKYNLSKEILLLHTPGHVGSVSVAKTLKPISQHYFFCNVHSLVGKYKITSARHMLQKVLAEKIKYRESSKKIKIITLVRDPVSRAVGGFFHNIDQWIFPEKKQLLLGRPNWFEVLYHHFNVAEKYNNLTYLHSTSEYQLNWFDEQVKFLFGIDVFKKEFDTEKGYKIYKKDNIELLVLKLELIEKCWNEAIGLFLSLSVPELGANNSAKNRNDYTFYREFKNKLKLGQKDFDLLYDNKYMEYFYSDSEIKQLMANWA